MSNLYIYEQGSLVSFAQNRLIVEDKKKENSRFIPIENIDNLVLFGGIQVTAACIQSMLMRGVNLTWLSKTGEFYGRLESTSHVNILRQRLQFRKSEDTVFRLGLAKQLIKGKCSNQKTIIQRFFRTTKQPELADIAETIRANLNAIDNAGSIEELMGLEGYTAKLYFKALSSVMPVSFRFDKRSKRPPRDPFNSLISFGYTLLHYEIYTMLVNKGLNPYAAFLHADKHQHPALCSDLMEEWRAALIDTLAVALINTNKITLEHFIKDEASGGVFLDKEGCKLFITEYKKRMRQEVFSPS